MISRIRNILIVVFVWCLFLFSPQNFIFCVEEVDGSEPAKDVVAFSESNAVSSDDVSNDLSINHPLPKPKATFLRRLKRSVGGPEKKYFVPNRNNFLNLKVTGNPLTDTSLPCLMTCYWEQSKTDGLYYIPYVLGSEYVNADKQLILDCMRYFEQSTDIRFVAYNTVDIDANPHSYYVYITSGSGCWSNVGRRVLQGSQLLSLEISKCLSYSIMRHEFGHLLGLNHEHQRFDRDNYVQIYLQNVNANVEDQFSIDEAEPDGGNYSAVVNDYGYDYASVMHYSSITFSKNGALTIDAVYPQFSSAIRFPHTLLSLCDWHKLLTLYPGPSSRNLPDKCVSNSRGRQVDPTPKCEKLYGSWNCIVACHFSGSDLIPFGLCQYASGTEIPIPATEIKPHPYFPTDADHSARNSELFWRTFLVRYSYLGGNRYI